MKNYDSYKRKLDQVAEIHSYEAGFNGKMAKYRIWRLAQTISNIKRKEWALEIGCGEGTLTLWLATRFKNVVAIEPAKKFYEYTKMKIEKNKIYNVVVKPFLLEEFTPSIKFDCIIATGVLEHVIDPSCFLKKVYDCMHENSYFLLTVPNATSLHRRLGKRMGLIKDLFELGPLDYKVGHYRYYDFPSLRNELETNGFQILEMKGILLKPLPNEIMISFDESYCDALFYLGDELPEYCAEIYCCCKKSCL